MKLVTPAVAVVIGLGLAVTSCGSDAITVTSNEPIALEPAELVWETGISGGFFTTEYELRLYPDLIILGDGRAVRPGPASAEFSGQALTPLEQTVLEPAELREVLSRIGAAGVFEPTTDYGELLITDVATTTVSGRLDAQVVTTSAYGLGIGTDDPSLSSEQRRARQDLEALIEDVAAIVDRPGRTWRPVTAPEVLVFTLSFPAPSEAADEPIAWPLDPALVELAEGAFSRCVVVSGTDLDSLLEVAATATEYTPWVVDDREVHLAFRPRYPHQDECPS